MDPSMTWAGGFGTGGSFREALERAAFQARERLGEEPDFLLFFSTRPLPGKEIPPLPGRPLLAGARVHQVWKPGTGWTRAPSISLLAASFPFPRFQALRFRRKVLPTPDQSPRTWRRILGFEGPRPSALLLLAGQKAYHLVPLLPGLQSALPETTLAGGVLGVAGGPDRGGTLFMSGPLQHGEALGLALDRPASMKIHVVRGYRALGPPHRVTALSGEEVGALDGREAWAVLKGELPGEGTSRDIPLLAEVSSRPPEPGGNLACGEARMVVRAGKRVRILTPGGTRRGQWIRFCLPDPEETKERIRTLPVSPARKGNEGCAVLFACPAPSSGPLDDPALALVERLGERPLLGARSWAQIAAPPGCGPLLLGQTLVLCEIRDGDPRPSDPGPKESP